MISMEIIQGIHQIEAGKTADFGFYANCFLIEQDGLILIDTGLSENKEKILSYITGNIHLDPRDIHTIILTHYHQDHTGNIIELQQITGAKIAIHLADAKLLSDQIKQNFQQKEFKSEEEISNKEKFLNFTPDILLNDGEIISGMQCIHVPGHTPGNIAVLDSKRKILFCGDTIFGIDGKVGIPQGIQERMKTMGTLNTARESMNKLSTLDYNALLFGHGDPILENASDAVIEFINRF
jgi:hydroxyacylglutathione hydrolase